VFVSSFDIRVPNLPPQILDPPTIWSIAIDADDKTWYHKPKKDNLYNQYWCIARNGDLLTIADNPDKIIHYKYGGLDTNSNPILAGAGVPGADAGRASHGRPSQLLRSRPGVGRVGERSAA
jgi:hypothetical protein